ncbi:venom serine protease 34-like [Sabethes cyaneus]|uniref:venom serine protease 34-like n=1 Tax=Sabethes cyaneus TaxID=53552 RepID=UPI00237E64AE|nr:venom serine protease 34-like [Sabethes cyaneus]
MVDGLTFCGNGTVERNSVANRMFVRLRSTSSSPGGTLICRMRAILQNCTCGRKNNMRIVNGAPAMINEFPMMAALVDIRTRAVFCGAVIVAERYALTTAYCLQGRTIRETALLVGDHDLSTGAETMYAQLYVVAEFLKHPGFTMHPIENDIALLRTVQPIQYNPGVGPVCLPWKYRHQDFDGAVVEACGWGNLDFGGPQSEVLQKVSLDVISNQHCSELLNSSISNEKMCTYIPSRDVCQSDYGGPLFFTEPQSGAVYDLGIISYGLACAASEPSVNTRLTEYLDWIVTNSPNTFYCVK